MNPSLFGARCWGTVGSVRLAVSTRHLPNHSESLQNMQAIDIQKLIQEAIPGSEVTVRGDDGVHFEAIVISAAFEGENLVRQHRRVYQALGGRMESEEIHALALKTYTPDSWRRASDRE